MTTAIAPREDRTLFHIVDDLVCFQETLDMLDAQLAEALPDDERAEITKGRSEVVAKLDAIHAELAKKTDDVAIVLRRMDGEYDYQDEEVARIRARREAIDKARKNLRQYVVNVMQRNGVRTLKTRDNTLFRRKTDAVIVTDAAKLPAEYQNAEVRLPLNLWHAMRGAVRAIGPPELLQEVDTLRVNAEPSASTIKRAIKSGVEVPGADLQINEGLVLR